MCQIGFNELSFINKSFSIGTGLIVGTAASYPFSKYLNMHPSYGKLLAFTNGLTYAWTRILIWFAFLIN